MRYIIVLILCFNVAIAQKIYEIPFESKDNRISISVENISAFIAEGIKVKVTNIPNGITFKEKVIAISSIKSKEEQIASFFFSVEKNVKINKVDTLDFNIIDTSGQSWKKEITIRILPPSSFELFQNYPNPFNPVTTIEYQLPGTGNKFDVSLKVYDAIGREVANLVTEQQDPGYYQKTFDASRYASGMYIYRLTAKDDRNKYHSFVKKMLMVK